MVVQSSCCAANFSDFYVHTYGSFIRVAGVFGSPARTYDTYHTVCMHSVSRRPFNSVFLPLPRKVDPTLKIYNNFLIQKQRPESAFSPVYRIATNTMGKQKRSNGKRRGPTNKGSHHKIDYDPGAVEDEDVKERNEELGYCQEITGTTNALKGLQLRMWDFAQCDPKRCTGARLAKRGIFQKMGLKQPFRGLVLSPQGTQSVSPADLNILETSGMSLM